MTEAFEVSFQTDEAAKLILIKGKGPIDSKRFIDQQIAFFDTIPEPWAYDRLCELDACSGHVSYFEVTRFAIYWGSRRRQTKRMIKLAVITTNAFIITRLPNSNLQFPNHIMQAFPTIAAARDWLNRH